VPVPDNLDPAEAVSLVLNYVTAYQMIHRVAKLREGQSFLIHGAGGGVGTAALQLGKIAGLRMFGTASKSKLELVSALGATPIDYRAENFRDRIRQLVPEGLDAAFDSVGDKTRTDTYRCLRRGGYLVCFGVSSAVEKGKLSAALGFAWLGVMKLVPDGKHPVWFTSNGCVMPIPTGSAKISPNFLVCWPRARLSRSSLPGCRCARPRGPTNSSKNPKFPGRLSCSARNKATRAAEPVLALHWI